MPLLLDNLERAGAEVRTFDPLALTRKQLWDAYAKTIESAQRRKYQIKRIFGSKHSAAKWFGLQVPALVVERTADGIVDVYPHLKAGEIITIHRFLTATLDAVAAGGEFPRL